MHFANMDYNQSRTYHIFQQGKEILQRGFELKYNNKIENLVKNSYCIENKQVYIKILLIQPLWRWVSDIGMNNKSR